MPTELSVSYDGVVLARSVRAVAARAQKTLKQPANPGEARDLIQEIASLEDATENRASEELSRWLSNLRGRIESHGQVEQ